MHTMSQQVLCIFFKALHTKFTVYIALEKTEVPLSFKLWCSANAQEHPQFYYWSVVLEMDN